MAIIESFINMMMTDLEYGDSQLGLPETRVKQTPDMSHTSNVLQTMDNAQHLLSPITDLQSSAFAEDICSY
jgi:hypothetical protein